MDILWFLPIGILYRVGEVRVSQVWALEVLLEGVEVGKAVVSLIMLGPLM